MFSCFSHVLADINFCNQTTTKQSNYHVENQFSILLQEHIAEFSIMSTIVSICLFSFIHTLFFFICKYTACEIEVLFIFKSKIIICPKFAVYFIQWLTMRLNFQWMKICAINGINKKFGKRLRLCGRSNAEIRLCFGWPITITMLNLVSKNPESNYLFFYLIYCLLFE